MTEATTDMKDKQTLSFYARRDVIDAVFEVQADVKAKTGFSPSRSVIIATLVEEALEARKASN